MSRSRIGAELVLHCSLLPCIEKARLERITGKRNELFPREPNGIAEREIILIHVSAEVSRIIRIDGDKQALIEHSADGVMEKAVDHAQPEIGQGAKRQRYPRLCESRDEGVVVE